MVDFFFQCLFFFFFGGGINNNTTLLLLLLFLPQGPTLFFFFFKNIVYLSIGIIAKWPCVLQAANSKLSRAPVERQQFPERFEFCLDFEFLDKIAFQRYNCCRFLCGMQDIWCSFSILIFICCEQCRVKKFARLNFHWYTTSLFCEGLGFRV